MAAKLLALLVIAALVLTGCLAAAYAVSLAVSPDVINVTTKTVTDITHSRDYSWALGFGSILAFFGAMCVLWIAWDDLKR